jgi:hypothetical protein
MRAPISWDGVRSRYVTGDDSYAQLAVHFGISKKTVEKRALNRTRNGGKTWSEWRGEYRADLCNERTALTRRIKAQASAIVSMQHAELLANLATEARAAVKGVFAELQPRDRVKLALAIIELERRVHGLDRAPVQLEISGRNGDPIEHEVAIGEVDDAFSGFAARVLEMLFGDKALADLGALDGQR